MMFPFKHYLFVGFQSLYSVIFIFLFGQNPANLSSIHILMPWILIYIYFKPLHSFHGYLNIPFEILNTIWVLNVT
ncbi:hypothetical protein GLYMA_19G028300v4 [Glycine max]|uniref:Uncharacterized protein n=1 Tax=Glycine max TaxID=3847 RepID=K7MW74_SOYBN|nr:hypothetical protein JHK85_052984 [Glycine max]KAH1076163.1 hypothetical protein GYH30_051864 [Glycine max]KRG93624.1 hypothetical protein GLYMA_19G028300v4 [Glycine max]